MNGMKLVKSNRKGNGSNPDLDVNDLNNQERKSLLAFLIGSLKADKNFSQTLVEGIRFVTGGRRKKAS